MVVHGIGLKNNDTRSFVKRNKIVEFGTTSLEMHIGHKWVRQPFKNFNTFCTEYY